MEGWRGYVESFPEYLIHPHRLVVDGQVVAMLGHTTGSHLGLPDDEETRLTVIWLVEVAGERVRSWTLIEDTAEHRAELGLDRTER